MYYFFNLILAHLNDLELLYVISLTFSSDTLSIVFTTAVLYLSE